MPIVIGLEAGLCNVRKRRHPKCENVPGSTTVPNTMMHSNVDAVTDLERSASCVVAIFEMRGSASGALSFLPPEVSGSLSK